LEAGIFDEKAVEDHGISHQKNHSLQVDPNTLHVHDVMMAAAVEHRIPNNLARHEVVCMHREVVHCNTNQEVVVVAVLDFHTAMVDNRMEVDVLSRPDHHYDDGEELLQQEAP
jgi:hypothetical protein